MSKAAGLLFAIRREIPLKVTSPESAEKTVKVNPLLERIQLIKRLGYEQDHFMTQIRMLHWEVKWIRWLQVHRHHRSLDFVELQLAVERYPGRAPWWLDIENSYYLEKQFRSAPKLKNYHLGNYWEQVEYYEKHGTADVPGVNTEQFILDRAGWVYKYIGKEIKRLRRLLWIARNWDFTDEQTAEFEKLYNRISVYL